MQNFKIKEEKENLLFNRKEIYFEVQADVTPSRSETLKFISEKFSSPIENIKIKNIKGRFGSNIFSGSVFIYKSEKDKDRLEIKKKKDEKLKESLSKHEEREVKKEPKEEKAEEESKTEKTKEAQQSENAKKTKQEESKTE